MPRFERVGHLKDANGVPRFCAPRERAEGELRRFKIAHRMHSGHLCRYVLARTRAEAVAHYVGQSRAPGLSEEHLHVTELPD